MLMAGKCVKAFLLVGKVATFSHVGQAYFTQHELSHKKKRPHHGARDSPDLNTKYTSAEPRVSCCDGRFELIALEDWTKRSQPPAPEQ